MTQVGVYDSLPSIMATLVKCNKSDHVKVFMIAVIAENQSTASSDSTSPTTMKVD